MWTFARGIPSEWNIIAPQAPLPDPIGGFSWWAVGEETISRTEIDRAGDLLEHFIDKVPSHYGLNPKFIVACGFSQGAGVLSVLLSRNPNLFRGVAILAGFVIKPEQELSAAASSTKVFIGHGTNDQTVPLSKAEWGRDWLWARGYEVTFVADDVGHKVGTQGMRALKEWILTL